MLTHELSVAHWQEKTGDNIKQGSRLAAWNANKKPRIKATEATRLSHPANIPAHF
jgi:hypothetical protein